MEDFYRDARRRHGVLMDGDEPVGGRWNLDAENREPPPRAGDTLGVPEPMLARRRTTSTPRSGPTWTGGSATATSRSSATTARDGSPPPATRRWPRSTTSSTDRLPSFGAYEDAVLDGDPWMAHSLVSAPLNLGLLDPLEVVRRAEEAYRAR